MFRDHDEVGRCAAGPQELDHIGVSQRGVRHGLAGKVLQGGISVNRESRSMAEQLYPLYLYQGIAHYRVEPPFQSYWDPVPVAPVHYAKSTT